MRADGRIDVLLVEDNDGDALLVEEALADADAHGVVSVRRAHDLGSALEAIEEATPDCVLLDLGLPDVFGELEALSRLLAARPMLAIVVLTGRADHQLAAGAVALGAQDYLVKTAAPSGEALFRAIQFAAQRARSIADLRTTRDELVEFSRLVAHDLQSPLATVVGFAELLSANPDIDEAIRDDALQRIVDVGRRMGRMVSGMLDYAESPGSVRSLVDLRDVVDWVEPLVAGELQAVGGRLEVAELESVLANEPALRTVVLNLLRNAVKYRVPDRSLHVRIWTVRADGRVTLHVEDNGLGIPAGQRDDVFRPGKRLRRDEESGVDGLGLGLSAVRRIVLQLEGEVGLRDAGSGDGTCVCVALPAAPADRDVRATA